MKSRLVHFCCVFFVAHLSRAIAADSLPTEPIEIGNQSQFVFDKYIVDNHWAIKYKREAVQRVCHQGKMHTTNPLITGDQPSFLWMQRDESTGKFQMWYQANQRVSEDKDKGRQFRTYIAYAESEDGVKWTKPDLDLFDVPGVEPNNVVLARNDIPGSEACGPCILDLPEKDRRGHRYVMLYRNKGPGAGDLNGIRLIGSQDGIHWDLASDTRIAHLHSDHHNTISYDATRAEYVMFCRPKHIYRTSKGEMIDTGASRRVARMTSKELWTDWLAKSEPQTMLIPDEIDSSKHFNFFYGMPTRYSSGIYWGFLEPFRMNDFVYTELAWSRDGINFERHAERPKLIEYGEEETWDDEMIFASPSWVEVGDEWWVYYFGWDGPHGTPDRTGSIGLATYRKEGFISMRGPRGGGVICTRKIRWPGGNLLINADATDGEIKVRVSDERRKPISGFDYDDCQSITSNSVRHQVKWKSSMDDFMGKVVRLEFFLQDADLFTFRANSD